jgi:nitrogen fixation/metabolism regulation signal transduction histidine kinase
MGTSSNGKSSHAKDRRQGASIRVRLALMLALFALAPSLIVTFLASQRIADSLELMKSPGVTRTLYDAFEVSKISLRRLEDALHAVSATAANDPEVARIKAGASETDTSSLKPLIERHSVDYVSVYAMTAGSGWRLAAEARRPGLGNADTTGSGASPGEPALAWSVRPDLPRPMAPGVFYDQAGWLVEAVQADLPGENTDGLLVIGYYMGPVFFNKVAEVGRGIGFFRRLDVLKGVYVGGIWIWAVVLLLAVAVATLLTARWAARGLSRPLVELADGMRQVARGDEGVVVEPKGSMETKFLTNTFNSMVGQLAAYKHDLALAERAAAWQDIARIAAHEIRNPLTPIQFAIRRIRERVKKLPERDQVEMRESLDSILGEVDTLKALASNFSQFAKLPEPSPAPEDLNKLTSETVELFREERSVDFVVELEEKLPHALADTSQMRMVLNNLLKNSIEAMPEGGTVTVRTWYEGKPEGGWIVLEIKDTGTGMDPDTLAKATDAYFSTKAKGSGLGLAVVHKIVLQHGGRLEITSAKGSGTGITIRLPAA